MNKTKLIGYGRCSTEDQDTEIQEAQLREAGCHVVLSEKRSGLSLKNREKLGLAIAILNEGDTLCVTEMSRLGRSLKDVLDVYSEIKEKGAKLKILDAPWLDSSITGELMMSVLGAFAAYDVALKKDRQRAGINRAKANGVYKGKKKTIDDSRIRALKAQGHRIADICREMSISRASCYRALKAPVAV